MTMANANGPPVPHWAAGRGNQPAPLDTDAVVIETLRHTIAEQNTTLDQASFAVAELRHQNDVLRQERLLIEDRYNELVQRHRDELKEVTDGRRRAVAECNVVFNLLRLIYSSMEWKPEADTITIDHALLLRWLIDMRDLLALIDARKGQ